LSLILIRKVSLEAVVTKQNKIIGYNTKKVMQNKKFHFKAKMYIQALNQGFSTMGLEVHFPSANSSNLDQTHLDEKF